VSEQPKSSRPRRARAAVIFLVGYLLSPLSWWNDALVNLPIAWAVASAASWAWGPLFTPVLVLAYWGTNVLGLLMMGATGTEAAGWRRGAHVWRYALLGSAAYTALILLLAWLGLARPIPAFWRQRSLPDRPQAEFRSVPHWTSSFFGTD
jgi:hypothetical protein